jgi:hypothetical protein
LYGTWRTDSGYVFDFKIIFYKFMTIKFILTMKSLPMKRNLIIMVLLVLVCLKSTGQSCAKQFGVANKNDLIIEQLNECLKEAKSFTLVSLGIVGLGALAIWGGLDIVHNGLADDATFFEQLMGSNFMGKLYAGLGLAMVSSGTVCCIVGLGRIGSIKTMIRQKDGQAGSLTLSPAIIINYYTHSFTPGIGIKIRF